MKCRIHDTRKANRKDCSDCQMLTGLDANIIAEIARKQFLAAQPNSLITTTWGNTLVCVLKIGTKASWSLTSKENETLVKLMDEVEEGFFNTVAAWRELHGLKKEK